MGRPLNKRYFGATTEDQIKVTFWDSVGASAVEGWIVSQKGSKRFVVTDGSVTETGRLLPKVPEVNTAMTDDGNGDVEMSIIVKDDAGDFFYVTKIAGRKVTIWKNDGLETQAWSFADFDAADTVGVVEMEEAGDSTDMTGEDTFTDPSEFDSSL